MNLSFIRHEKITLKTHPGLSETWLHDMICKDTSLLGLGEVEVIDRERRQHSGGRLDMLLADSDNGIRFEVEAMLGPTDPNHIIRCIEYWDVERRRYPAYDHVAVLVAEEITTRFLNVIALLAGSIPLIAIQLNALKIGDSVALDFVKVLDERMLRDEDPGDTEGPDVDRQWWEARKGADNVQLCDRILELAQEKSDDKLQLSYKQSNISLRPEGSFFNVVTFWPKQKFLSRKFRLAEPADWVKRLEEAGIDARPRRGNSIVIRLKPQEFRDCEPILKELVHQAVAEWEA